MVSAQRLFMATTSSGLGTGFGGAGLLFGNSAARTRRIKLGTCWGFKTRFWKLCANSLKGRRG